MARSVVELAEAAARREQPGRALSAIIELRQRLEELEEFQVENARAQGWSWGEIAQPLGISRQAVHHKFARRLEDVHRGDRRDRMVVSADARQCVVRARREAAAFGHDSVGTDHLLLGLIAQEDIAAALAPLGVTQDHLLVAVTDLRGIDDSRSRREPSTGPIPISTKARDALEQSLREALRLGEHEIGAKHILLALLRDDEGAARRVLERLDAAPAAVEERIGNVRPGA